MPKYAHFRAEDAEPRRVLAWYDTDFAEYPELPEPGSMMLVDPEAWASRFATPFIEGGVLVPDPTPQPLFVPPAVTLFQARAQLRRMNLLIAVDTYVKALGGEALDAWEYANTVSRDGPLVAEIATQMGWDAAALDAFFQSASEISA